MKCRLAAGLLIVQLAGCSHSAPPDLVEPPRLVTAQAVEGELSLAVRGWIDNRSPVAYSPAISWMPFLDVVNDGATVVPGEVLVHHDTTMLREWITGGLAELAQIEADMRRQQLDRARTLDELLLQAASLRADQQIGLAKIAADQRDELSGRRLAGLQADEAQAVLARAERTLSAVEALAAHGRVPVLDVIRARTTRDQAQFQAEAAQRACREWDDGAPAIARQRLQLDVERNRRELDGARGIDGRIALLRELIGHEQVMAGEDEARVTRELAQRQAFAADPYLRSTTAGTVRLRDANVKIGAKLPATPCLFVLEDQAMMAYVRIPEPLRDLATVWSPEHPTLGRAELTVRALGGRQLSGRVLSIAATPEKVPTGGRAFLAVVGIDDVQDAEAPGQPAKQMAKKSELKPGMGVDCALLLPIRGASLPIWAVHVSGDPRAPLIRLPTGGTRVLHGLVSDSRFIVTDGLTIGDQVIALADPDHDGVVARPRRLSGLVEPTVVVPVRLSSGSWDVVEVVPDGAPVAAGQRIARLAKTAWWMDPDQLRWRRDTEQLRAEADRSANRLRADQALAAATKVWRDADLDLRAARLAWQAAGLDDVAKRFAGAELARAAAAATADQARAAAEAAADPRVAVSLSRIAAADLTLAAARARAALTSATLEATAARSPDLLARLTTAASFVEAQTKAEDARSAWFVARISHAQELDRAERNYAQLAEYREQGAREMRDEEVFAPVAGRIFHRNWAPFRPGDSVWANEPFRILPELTDGSPVTRKLTVEVPAHLAGTWQPGAAMSVRVPGVGLFPGVVQTVGTWYGTSSAGRDEAEAGGSSTAVDEQVFNLSVIFTVPAAQAERVLPGMTAHVD